MTRYQIKTGKFSLDKAHVRSLFFRERSNELYARVKACFDQGGTFVAVLLGWDMPDRTDNEAAQACRDVLAEQCPQYANASVEVWRQNQLCGFFSLYQTLAAELTGRDHWRFQTHRSWARDEEMRRPLKVGVAQTRVIEDLRTALRDHADAVHVRICGQAGVGKTRLVLEATGEEDLAPLVAYYKSALTLRNDGLLRELQRDDSDLPVLLVVDDCDADDSVEFWNALRRRGPRVKFISLYQELEKSSGTTIYLEAERLMEAELSAILQEYGLEKPDADRWARECDGSPRVAHVFGQNLKEDPDAVRWTARLRQPVKTLFAVR